MRKKNIITIVIVLLILGLGYIIIDLNKEHIYNKKINSITIKYYEGYNYATGEAISDSIPLNKIKLKSKDLKEVSRLIKKLSKVKYSKNSEEYGHMQYDHLVDMYRLEINNSFIIYIGEEYGITDSTKDYFRVSKRLYNKISDIAKKNSKKNLYKKINSNKITIIHGKEKYEVTDKEELKKISNFNYYFIKGNDKEFEGEEVAYTLDLHDGRKIKVYNASVLSWIYYKDGTHKYIKTRGLEEYLDQIFENRKVKIIKDDVNKIDVTYKNKRYTIDDQNKIKELLKSFKNFKYNDYDYLKSMKESDFDANDIMIYVNNSKYIIPGNSGIANRYYIDEDGKFYDVSGFENSKTEKYFKKLVNY